MNDRVAAGLESQIKNIEARYGKPMSHWIRVARESGLTKHTEVIALLKADHKMSHGDANRVGLLARRADSPAPGAPADDLYAGKRAPLRPIHDKLMEVIRGFGGDVELSP